MDTAPDLNAALNHTLTSAGHAPVDEAMTRHWVGHGARMLIEQALAQQSANDAAAIDRLLDTFLAYYREHLTDRSRPYPGVLDTLKTLRARGASLAVVTNKPAAMTEPLLAQLDIAPLLSATISGDTAARPKPAPDPVLLCLEQLALDAHEALFVGDSDTDVNAARAADMAVVCMRDGYNHGRDPETLGADAVLDGFNELL